MKRLVRDTKGKLLFVWPLIGLFVVAFVGFVLGFSSPTLAQTMNTINFQGKVVRNDSGSEGLNVSSTETTCIAAGTDTCGFQVVYYDASTGGNTLGTETFTNVEIGDYDGVVNLGLGTGTYSAGTESSFVNIFMNNSTTYAEVAFDHDGNATYTEVFGRMAVRGAAYSIHADTADSINGMDEGDFVQFAPSSVQTDTSTVSSIFINKTGASGNILQLQKGGSDVLVLDNDGSLTLANDAIVNGLTVGRGGGDRSTNVALGLDSLSTNDANTGITALGYRSMYYASNTVSGIESGNTAVGIYSMRGSTTPADNTGNYNTAIGGYTLHDKKTGQYNTTVGFNSMRDTTDGDNNVAIGYYALNSNVANNRSTAIGTYAMQYANDSSTSLNTYNTAVGYNALRGSVTPSSNTGRYNTALGSLALTDTTSGDYNVGLGYYALQNVKGGDRNIGLGFNAGSSLTTGSSNIIIGDNVDAHSATGSSQLNIGNLIFATGGFGIGTNLAAGNVGIGDASPSAKFVVGDGDLFQVNSSGAIAAATGITSSGTITFSGLSDGIVSASSGVLSGGYSVDLTSDVTGILPMANGGTGSNLTDPGADRIMFWDDSAGTTTWLEAGSNLQISNTTLNATDTTYSAGDDLDLSGSTFNIESQLDYVTTISRASSNLTLQTTTSGDITLNPAGNVDLSADIIPDTDDTYDIGSSTMRIQDIYIGTSSLHIGADGDEGVVSFDTTDDELTISTDANIYGLTVGRGPGSRSDNTALGSGSLAANTTGGQNTAIGLSTITTSSTASGLTAVGANALQYTDSGLAMVVNSTAVGAFALRGSATPANNTGLDNTAIGGYALEVNTSGTGGVAVGAFSLRGNTTGDYNIGLGDYAGDNITTGSNNIIIGATIDAQSGTADDQLSIGNLIFATGGFGSGTGLGTGNVGIGDASPSAKFVVGNGDLFQVNSSGAIAAATGISSSGTITFSGLTTDGFVTVSSGVLGSQANLGLAEGGTGSSLVDPDADRIMFWDDSAGTGGEVTWMSPGNDISFGGTSLHIESQLDYVSTINRTSSNLTLQTTTSGDIVMNSAGGFDIDAAGAYAIDGTTMEWTSTGTTNNYTFVASTLLSGEQDAFVVSDNDNTDATGDESSSFKAYKDGTVSNAADGYSIVEISTKTAQTLDANESFYISGRAVTEGALTWGVSLEGSDGTNPDFWTTGGIYAGATGTDCAGTNAACFNSPAFSVASTGVITAPTLTNSSADLTLSTSTSGDIVINPAGNVDLRSHIIPDTDDTYDLGSSSYRFRDLYLGPSSLHIGANGDEATITFDTATDTLTTTSAVHNYSASTDANSYQFTGSTSLSGEKDMFNIIDPDATGTGQDEGSSFKILKSGTISNQADGFSLMELTFSGGSSLDPNENFYILGRKTDEGTPTWGVSIEGSDSTTPDIWTTGGFASGTTATSCAGTDAPCFNNPTFSVLATGQNTSDYTATGLTSDTNLQLLQSDVEIANTAGTTTHNVINIDSTIRSNTAGALGTHQLNGINIEAPTVSCSYGSCVKYGININSGSGWNYGIYDQSNDSYFASDVTFSAGADNAPAISLTDTGGDSVWFDNGDVRLTVHDGYGNFNLKHADHDDQYISTSGAWKFRADNAGTIYWQTAGTGTIGNTVSWNSMTMNSTGAISMPSTLTVTNDASIYGLTVGRGSGNQVSNAVLGYLSMGANTTGYDNTAVGESTLRNNTEGAHNTAIGYRSMLTNTTGRVNTAVGENSLYSNTVGEENIAFGQSALYSNKANSRSTALGYYSMMYADNRTTGRDTYNTAVGFESLRGSTTAANNTGQYNTAIGDAALRGNTSGNYNTAIGRNASYANTTGFGNIALGYNSGDNITTGDRNIMIGYGIDAQSATDNLQLSIGNLIMAAGGFGTGTTAGGGYVAIAAVPDSSYKLKVAGNIYATSDLRTDGDVRFNKDSSTNFADLRQFVTSTNYIEINTTGGYRGITTFASSIKYKENVTDLEVDSTLLYDLRPVSFDWKNMPDSQRTIGLIAEEVLPIIPELIMYDSDGEILSVNYPLITTLNLNEIQKHEAAINEIEDNIANGVLADMIADYNDGLLGGSGGDLNVSSVTTNSITGVNANFTSIVVSGISTGDLSVSGDLVLGAATFNYDDTEEMLVLDSEIKVEKLITNQIEIDRTDEESRAAGSETVLETEEFVLVESTSVTEDSIIILTTRRLSDGTIIDASTDNIEEGSFEIHLDRIAPEDVVVDWLIIQ